MRPAESGFASRGAVLAARGRGSASAYSQPISPSSRIGAGGGGLGAGGASAADLLGGEVEGAVRGGVETGDLEWEASAVAGVSVVATFSGVAAAAGAVAAVAGEIEAGGGA